MCGIVYVHDTEQKGVSEKVLKHYNLQKSRGSEGYGFVSFNNQKVVKVGRAEYEGEIKVMLAKYDASHVLFHHRFPTSTVNIKEACHPIRVASPRLDSVWYVVHNGVITNDDALKKEHEKLGYKYTTAIEKKTLYTTARNTYQTIENQYNDSEAFAIDLVETLEGKQSETKSEGAIAFIALETSKDGEALTLYWGRNGGNPLGIEKRATSFSIRSEGGEPIKTHMLYSMDIPTKTMQEIAFKVGSYPYEQKRGSIAWEGKRGSLHYNNYQYSETGYDSLNQKYDDESEEESVVVDDVPTISGLDFTPKEMIDDLGMTPEEVLDILDDEIATTEELLREAVYVADKDGENELDKRLALLQKRRAKVYEAWNELLAKY